MVYKDQLVGPDVVVLYSETCLPIRTRTLKYIILAWPVCLYRFAIMAACCGQVSQFILWGAVMNFRANLSRDYFVDRQDRYVLFKDSKELADYFADVVDLTLSHSYTLNSDGSTLPPSALAIDPLSSAKGAEMFKASLGKAMKQLMGSDQPLPVDTFLTSKGAEKSLGKATRGSDHQPDPILCSNGAQMSLMGSDEPLPDLTATESSSELDTVVCPLIQMGFCGIRLEEAVTLELLSSLCKDDSLYLASGYFNLPPLYSEALFNGRGTCNILAASPQVSSQQLDIISPVYSSSFNPLPVV